MLTAYPSAIAPVQSRGSDRSSAEAHALERGNSTAGQETVYALALLDTALIPYLYDRADARRPRTTISA